MFIIPDVDTYYEYSFPDWNMIDLIHKFYNAVLKNGYTYRDYYFETTDKLEFKISQSHSTIYLYSCDGFNTKLVLLLSDMYVDFIDVSTMSSDLILFDYNNVSTMKTSNGIISTSSLRNMTNEERFMCQLNGTDYFNYLISYSEYAQEKKYSSPHDIRICNLNDNNLEDVLSTAIKEFDKIDN